MSGGVGGLSMIKQIVLVATLLGVASSAAAETRTFLVPNSPDGYGIDQCLASGASCGRMVATSYCKSRDFAAAASFRRVEKGEITGAIPVSDDARDAYVAIECSR